MKNYPMIERCQARNRAGTQCMHFPKVGQRVCHLHGGHSPQALRKAEERLRALEHPSIDAVAQIIEHGDPDATRLAAARYILELLGHKAVIQANVDQQVTIRVVDETQPIVIEHAYELRNGRADS